MADAAVVNASPLIFLSKAGLIDLLRVVSPRVMVPEPVAMEIGRRGSDDVTAKVLADTPWLISVPVETIQPLIQSWDLGATGRCDIETAWHVLVGENDRSSTGACRRMKPQ